VTTIKEHIEKLGDAGSKVIGYAIIGSILNILSDAVDELEDDELSLAIERLQEMVGKKLEMVLNTDIEELG